MGVPRGRAIEAVAIRKAGERREDALASRERAGLGNVFSLSSVTNEPSVEPPPSDSSKEAAAPSGMTTASTNRRATAFFERETPTGCAGRNRRTLSESTIVAFAATRCASTRGRRRNSQALRAGRHVAESAQPDEAVRVVEVAELADHLHADRLLRLDELAVEELDQHVTLPRMERVLTKLDDRRPAWARHAPDRLPARWPYGKIHKSGNR
jgi:hypothetical protein